ncbi:MAG: PAS domain S-box protein [Opitutaceae bacterium]|nr:PAS domain S-box protein [Opitutaceae bacterium]
MPSDRQLESSLKEINDLRAALDEHAIVAITDPQGRITYVNDKFCAISQYRRDELLGQDHRLINSGHHPPEFFRQLWTTIARGRVWKGEIRNRAKDGSCYWVDTTIVPFLDDAGRPRQYVAIRADITERKRAEETLRESESRFRTMADTAPVLIWVSGTDQRCTWFNRPWLDFVGRPLEQEIGEGWIENVHADDRAGCLATYQAAFAARRPFTMEYRLRRHDGAWRWVSDTGVPRLGPAQEFSGYIGSCIDVTERKQAGEEIRRLNAELERRVAQRTGQLEAANRELEAFSYSVSHDLRAPLRAIDGFSQALLEDFGGQLPAEGRHQLLTVRAGAQRMGALIDDLLTFSRFSRQPLKKQPVDMARLVRSALEELEPQRRGRTFEHRVDPLPPVEGDPALLRQVWVNLLGNAHKYTRLRPVAVIEVGGRREGAEIVYHVRDNGTGFDPRYAARLFGVFQRLHRLEEFEGTGVGLAIVQRIVQRHGGRVWAEAAVDRGATFHFTLPPAAHA